MVETAVSYDESVPCLEEHRVRLLEQDIFLLIGVLQLGKAKEVVLFTLLGLIVPSRIYLEIKRESVVFTLNPSKSWNRSCGHVVGVC